MPAPEPVYGQQQPLPRSLQGIRYQRYDRKAINVGVVPVCRGGPSPLSQFYSDTKDDLQVIIENLSQKQIVFNVSPLFLQRKEFRRSSQTERSTSCARTAASSTRRRRTASR